MKLPDDYAPNRTRLLWKERGEESAKAEEVDGVEMWLWISLLKGSPYKLPETEAPIVCIECVSSGRVVNIMSNLTCSIKHVISFAVCNLSLRQER